MGLADGVDRKMIRMASWQANRAMEIAACAGMHAGDALDLRPLSLQDFDKIKPVMEGYEILVYEPGPTSLSLLWSSGTFKLKQVNFRNEVFSN